VYESDMLTEYYWISSASLHPPTSVARSAGFVLSLPRGSWGSAALHPRLYAVTRSAGFVLSLPRGSWGFAALHPRLYAVTRSAGLRIGCRVVI